MTYVTIRCNYFPYNYDIMERKQFEMENELFVSMPVKKAYFKLALPVVLGMAVSLVYNLVDTWFIAGTQNTALVAGVSLCAPVFTLMVAFGDIFGLGGSTAISRLLGQKRNRDAAGVSVFSIYAAILLGIAVAALMLIFRLPLLHLLGAREDTIAYASSYFIWLALGAPAIILNIVPGNLLRTEGLAKEAMFCTVIGALINIVLDPIFIFALGFGAGGAAAATVLSNVISDILLFSTIYHKAKFLSIHLRDFVVSSAVLRDILFIGIPASITNLMQSLAILLTNRFLLPYGTGQVAAYGIAMKVNMVCILILVGFAFGAQPLLGYNFGAGNRARLKEIIRFDIMIQIITASFFALISLFFAPLLIRLFMQDPAVVTAGAQILRCVMLSAPAVGIILVCTTLFQAEGKSLPALILAISRQGVVLVLCLVVMSHSFGYIGVLLSQALSDLITLGIALLFLRAGSKPESSEPV